MVLRDDVLKALEEARKAKVIGSSSEARVHLYPAQEKEELIKQIPELDKVFIVSQVEVHPPVNSRILMPYLLKTCMSMLSRQKVKSVNAAG